MYQSATSPLRLAKPKVTTNNDRHRKLNYNTAKKYDVEEHGRGPAWTTTIKAGLCKIDSSSLNAADADEKAAAEKRNTAAMSQTPNSVSAGGSLPCCYLCCGKNSKAPIGHTTKSKKFTLCTVPLRGSGQHHIICPILLFGLK